MYIYILYYHIVYKLGTIMRCLSFDLIGIDIATQRLCALRSLWVNRKTTIDASLPTNLQLRKCPLRQGKGEGEGKQNLKVFVVKTYLYKRVCVSVILSVCLAH